MSVSVLSPDGRQPLPAPGVQDPIPAAQPTPPAQGAPESPTEDDETEAGLLAQLLSHCPKEPPAQAHQVIQTSCVATMLCGLFGLALGIQGGLVSALEHSLQLSLLPAIVALPSVPPLFILLLLTNSEPSPVELLAATARFALATGVVLAGSTPFLLLFQLTVGSLLGVQLVAALCLFAAFTIGVTNLVLELIRQKRSLGRRAPTVALVGFGLFALTLSVRLWSSLPYFSQSGGV